MNIVENFYSKYYEQVFNRGNSFSVFASNLTHKSIEKDLEPFYENILEIGAGKGEHYKFVNHDFSEYVMVDLYDKPKNFALDDNRVTWIKGDICQINFPDETFDRILSMCVLHHLENPMDAILRIERWLKPGGVATIFLPSDPGLLNRINRAIFVTPRCKKLGFEYYDLVNALEHHNHSWSLKLLLKHAFRAHSIKIKWYPFGIPLLNLSLFSVWKVIKSSK